MEHSQLILQYLQKNPKARAFEIVQGVGFARRMVFRTLGLLLKRGQVKKEGFHPKIYYSSMINMALKTPGVSIKNASQSSINLDAPALLDLQKQLDEVRKELTQARHDLYNKENELNRKNLDLKGALAKINYMEGQIEQVKKRENGYFEETKRLRTDIESLQKKLRETR